MKTKNLIALALLLFVGVSVAILIGRELRETSGDAAIVAAEEIPRDALVVYYFHGETRCPTCRRIENYSREVFQTAFAEELAHEKVVWKVVNYEDPANSHFATDYKIFAPTVVLVRMVEGKPTEWRNLSRVWELVGNQEVFTQYIRDETRTMLGS